MADPYEITWHPEGVPIFEEGSEAWIDHYARLHALTFDGMMHCARRFLEEGKQTTIQLKVNRGPDVTQGNMMKFWQHYERVTFSRVPEEKKGRFIGYT